MRREVAAGLLLVALAPGARAAECSSVTLPEHSRVGEVALRLNGAGLREALLGIDVYVAGLYLPAPAHDARSALAASPRELRIHLLRDVAAADMASNIERNFRRAAGASFSRHAASLQRLIALIPPLAKGDTFSLSSRSGEGVRIAHRGRAIGELPGDEFARTLFSIWLGDPPLSETLRAGLLGAPCAP